ncbi:MAG: manganese transporter [Planctomycetaceae bacterium]|nr:manganese transporter [Planctomycetaceae bacterium]|tara:strand:+ start:490 stop:1497 length:1008 start_codon:yes stop_codon:yes gene_type:complete
MFQKTGLAAFLTMPILMVMTLCLQSCGSSKGQNEQSQADGGTPPLEVVTTTGMIADLVRSIGGEAVRVQSLIGVGVDPHLYKPTRDDVAALLGAQIIFFNGHHLEGRMGEVMRRAGEDRPTIAITETIASNELLYPDGVDDHPDPHLWLSPRLWGACSEAVLEGLTSLRESDAEMFKANHDKLLEKCDQLERSGRSAIASIPSETRVLITSHDAFSYFGRAFDIEVQAIQGITTESEAGLADLEALVTLVVERNIPAVFIESSVPRRSIQALIEGAAAKGHDVVIGGELFSDSMGPEGSPEGTWVGMVMHDIQTVTKGLGGTVDAEAAVESTEPK